MTERLTDFITRRHEEIEAALRESLPASSQPGAQRLNDALAYALFPGGKRLRPVLALLAAKLAGATRAQGLLVGCAVEFLHSSSLILDDLPGMDDADLRRNRRALHLVYGEGLAVLTAVALLNQAYALLSRAAKAGGKPGTTGALMEEVVRCVGADGMIGGQVVDLETHGACAGETALASRDLKTIALMRLMMVAGALACGAEADEAATLAKFGECFGRAYQICDDLSDELAAESALAKTPGQDARHRRSTCVSVLGSAASQRLAAALIEEGASLLVGHFGERVEVRLLIEAAHLMLHRMRDIEGDQSCHASVASSPGRRVKPSVSEPPAVAGG